MSAINIEKCQAFSHSGCNFKTYGESQFLMVAEYWDTVKESNSSLSGFGKHNYSKCAKDCIAAIEQAVKEEFDADNKIGVETLLAIPVVVMRFTLYPREITELKPNMEKR